MGVAGEGPRSVPESLAAQQILRVCVCVYHL